MYKIFKGITVVSQGRSPNYNLPSNQIKAFHTEWEKEYYRERKIAMHFPLQWLIYVRNYGVIRYQGEIFNLNLTEQRNEVYRRLIAEGIIGYEEVERTDGKGSTRELVMLLEELRFINTVPSCFFIINLMIHYFEELTEQEIEEYNRVHVPIDWKEITVEDIDAKRNVS